MLLKNPCARMNLREYDRRAQVLLNLKKYDKYSTCQM